MTEEDALELGEKISNDCGEVQEACYWQMLTWYLPLL